MDRPDVDPETLRKSLAFIRRANNFFNYTAASIRHLERFSRGWRPGEAIRLLDVATGSADIPRAMLAWADRKGLDLRIVAVDLHAQTLRTAAEGGDADPRLTFVRGDALHLPFADGSFDYAHTAMFLHHLDGDAAVRVLREMDRISRRGVIAADLLRHDRAYAWITLFTLFANPMVRHDGRVSVAQAFTRPEVLRMRERAGVGYATYYRHFAHRFALAGEKAARADDRVGRRDDRPG